MESLMHVAKKYAKSYLNIFSSELSLNNLYQFDLFYYFLKSNHNILFFLQLPISTLDQKKRSIDLLVNKFSLPTGIDQLILLLIKHKKISLLPSVIKLIKNLFEEQNNIIEFNIYSSHNLTDAELKSLESFLRRSTGKEVILKWRLDQSLVAGIKITSLNLGWEFSIKQQLNSLNYAH